MDNRGNYDNYSRRDTYRNQNNSGRYFDDIENNDRGYGRRNDRGYDRDDRNDFDSGYRRNDSGRGYDEYRGNYGSGRYGNGYDQGRNDGNQYGNSYVPDNSRGYSDNQGNYGRRRNKWDDIEEGRNEADDRGINRNDDYFSERESRARYNSRSSRDPRNSDESRDYDTEFRRHQNRGGRGLNLDDDDLQPW
jgi:hypothetical protein